MPGKKWLMWIIILLIVSGFIMIMGFSIQKPPLFLIKTARSNLTKARQLKSSVYSESLYRKAEMYYDSALFYWNRENERLIILRNFDQVIRCAGIANEIALQSIEKTKHTSQNVNNYLRKEINKWEKEIDNYHRIYGKIKLSKAQRRQLDKGETLFKESVYLFEKNEFSEAQKKIDLAQEYLPEVLNYSKSVLNDYFKNYPHWENWINQTLANSRKQNNTCVIIDKYNRKCYVYKIGNMIQSFDIELSENWLGNKKKQGDKNTPEGIYKITKKKSNGDSKFHKALLLNYPNESDKERFQLNKQNGIVNKNDKIGSLIEIHGHGGKGYDWTDGCKALTNNDMDKLFDYCNIGTEVSIVGSMLSFEKIIEKYN